MKLDDFLEGLRPELEALPTPEATGELRARILASRAAGVRTILPNPTAPRHVSTRLVIGIAIAAALALLFVPRPDDSFGSPGVFGQVAFAQPPTPATLDPIRLTAPERWRPMSLEFERRVADTTVSHIALQLVAASESWRLTSVEHRTEPAPSVSVETVFVSRSLRLLRRTIHVAPYSGYQRINVWQEFRTADSVAGHMNTEGPSIGVGRRFARQLPPQFAPHTTESLFPFFLMAAPLSRDWSGGASLLGWAVRDDDVLYPIELRVEGEEQIAVPAGRFACWRLSLRFAGRRLDYWVRKTDGLGVRMLESSRAREVVLTRIAP